MANTINPINSAGLNQINTVLGTNASQSGGAGVIQNDQGVSFSDYLSSALNNVNDLQQNAKSAEDKLATGEIQDIHSVTVAAEEADLALQFTLAIRNKFMDAYSEIMRMQV